LSYIYNSNIIKNLSVGISILFLFVFSQSNIQAQQATTTSGGNATGSGGSVSYTLGQMVYSTNSGTNGSIAEGVQQPYEISVVDGIEKAKDISLSCTIFPNPTNDFLILKIENYDIKNLTYQLFDLSGKFLDSKKIINKESKITMTNLVLGTYIIKVVQSNNDSSQLIKTFKIIYNH